MKKLLLLAALLLGTATGFSQGNVVFNNFAPNTNFRLWTNNAFGTASNLMANGGTHYRIGLYVSATNEGASLELVGTVGNTGLQPGYFSGQNPFTLPAPYGPGTPINFQIRAWSVAGGASYADALTAINGGNLDIAIGTSAIGTVTPAGVGPAAPLFGTATGLLTRGFEIAPVPEPSSIALGLLGLGAIALFRRRK